MKSAKYLDMAMQKHSLKFDKDLANLLQITNSAVSQYRSGQRIMDDETCLSLALALDINPMEIIGAACIDRAEKSGQKSLWEIFISRTQTVKTAGVSALLCFVFVTNILTSQEAKAAPALDFKGTVDIDNLYYVKLMFKILRILLGKFSAAKRTIFSQLTACTATA